MAAARPAAEDPAVASEMVPEDALGVSSSTVLRAEEDAYDSHSEQVPQGGLGRRQSMANASQSPARRRTRRRFTTGNTDGNGNDAAAGFGESSRAAGPDSAETSSQSRSSVRGAAAQVGGAASPGKAPDASRVPLAVAGAAAGPGAALPASVDGLNQSPSRFASGFSTSDSPSRVFVHPRRPSSGLHPLSTNPGAHGYAYAPSYGYYVQQLPPTPLSQASSAFPPASSSSSSYPPSPYPSSSSSWYRIVGTGQRPPRLSESSVLQHQTYQDPPPAVYYYAPSSSSSSSTSRLTSHRGSLPGLPAGASRAKVEAAGPAGSEYAVMQLVHLPPTPSSYSRPSVHHRTRSLASVNSSQSNQLQQAVHHAQMAAAVQAQSPSSSGVSTASLSRSLSLPQPPMSLSASVGAGVGRKRTASIAARDAGKDTELSRSTRRRKDKSASASSSSASSKSSSRSVSRVAPSRASVHGSQSLIMGGVGPTLFPETVTVKTEEMELDASSAGLNSSVSVFAGQPLTETSSASSILTSSTDPTSVGSNSDVGHVTAAASTLHDILGRGTTPEEARGKTVSGRRPVSAQGVPGSGPTTSHFPAPANATGAAVHHGQQQQQRSGHLSPPMVIGEPSPTTPKEAADIQKSLEMAKEQQRIIDERRRHGPSVSLLASASKHHDHTHGLPQHQHAKRPSSKSVSVGSPSGMPRPTSGLAARRGPVAQDKARNLSVVTNTGSATEQGAAAGGAADGQQVGGAAGGQHAGLRTAPLNASFQRPQPSPTISRTLSNSRISAAAAAAAGSGQQTPRHATFVQPMTSLPAGMVAPHTAVGHSHTAHMVQQGSLSGITGPATAVPVSVSHALSHSHNFGHPHPHAHAQPHLIDPLTGRTVIPPSGHRPTHHIPPLSHVGPHPASAVGIGMHQILQQQQQQPTAQPTPGSVSLPARPSKAAFVTLFESMYDTLPDTRAIQKHIDEMLDNAAANIGKEIETERARRDEWEKRMDERMDEFKKNVSSELIMLEKRIDNLEKEQSKSRTGKSAAGRHTVPQTDTDAPMPKAAPLVGDDSVMQNLLKRIQELEKAAASSAPKTPSPSLKQRDATSSTMQVDDTHSPQTRRPVSNLRGS